MNSKSSSQRSPEPPDDERPPSRLFRLKYFIVLVVIFAIVPVAAVGWNDLYTHFLEVNKPEIKLLDIPRGIGLSPVSVKIHIADKDSGLDEAVVRIRQKRNVRQLKKFALNGKKEEDVTVTFDGAKSGLEEGTATLEIRAFDRSFWNNSAEESLPLRVDYRKPNIKVLSTQHNVRVGGSQLIFYQVFDEDIGISGVMVGKNTFYGLPASSIDKTLDDANLYAAVFAVPLNQDPANISLKLFAEDKVGNASSLNFPYHIADRQDRKVNLALTEEVLRDRVSHTADENMAKIEEFTKNSGQALTISGDQGSIERAIGKFKAVNGPLRVMNENELASMLSKIPQHEAYWSTPFTRPNAVTQTSFGDKITYTYDGQPIGEVLQTGEEMALPRDHNEVAAIGDGIVAFSENLGIYGRTLAIDHGLGLVSIYAHLNSVTVNRYDAVKRGQQLGFTGDSGFARNNSLYFEMRVQGVPVDPREWWDSGWFYGHIIGKTNELKKTLGIPVLIPLK